MLVFCPFVRGQLLKMLITLGLHGIYLHMHDNFPFRWHAQPPFKGRGLTLIASIKSVKMLIVLHCYVPMRSVSMSTERERCVIVM